MLAPTAEPRKTSTEEQNNPGPAQRLFTGALGTDVETRSRSRSGPPAGWQRCSDGSNRVPEPDPVDDYRHFSEPQLRARRRADSDLTAEHLGKATGHRRSRACRQWRRADAIPVRPLQPAAGSAASRFRWQPTSSCGSPGQRRSRFGGGFCGIARRSGRCIPVSKAWRPAAYPERSPARLQLPACRRRSGPHRMRAPSSAGSPVAASRPMAAPVQQAAPARLWKWHRHPRARRCRCADHDGGAAARERIQAAAQHAAERGRRAPGDSRRRAARRSQSAGREVRRVRRARPGGADQPRPDGHHVRVQARGGREVFARDRAWPTTCAWQCAPRAS